MSVISLPVTGGCLCGDIHYEADQSPFCIGYCHCRMCQRALGNVFGAAVIFRLEHFRFSNAEPDWYVSSSSARRGFCSRCGSPVAWQHNESDSIAVWLGTLDQPQDFQPQGHYNTENRVPWVDINPHLPDLTEHGLSHQMGTYGQE